MTRPRPTSKPPFESRPDAVPAPEVQPDLDRPTRSESAPSDDPGADVDRRWILAEELVNARDLGGTPIEGGASVAYGALYRGPPLAHLSAAGCREFAELGIRTVIDLRIPAEQSATPESSCVEETARVIQAPLPVPYNVSPANYRAILNAHDSIAASFRGLGAGDAYPIYIHCTWGRDRTGVLVAVVLRALGVSRDEIMREYLLSESTVGAYPESLEAALDAIDEAGGVEAYLASASVPASDVAALRERVTAPANRR